MFFLPESALAVATKRRTQTLERGLTKMTKVWCRLCLLWAVALGSNAHAAAAFVDAEAIPGNSLDSSGGTGVNDGRLGFFSDIYYDSARNDWWALSDRGPGGGSLHYSTRAQRFEISINP